MSVKIELQPLAAEQFILFQKYYKQISKLIESDIFNIKNGKIILDFDAGGEIQNIQKVLNYRFTIIGKI